MDVASFGLVHELLHTYLVYVYDGNAFLIARELLTAVTGLRRCRPTPYFINCGTWMLFVTWISATVVNITGIA